MKITELNLSQAISLGLQEPFAYITRLSQVTVGPSPVDLPVEELLEARFFGSQREIRIWNDSGDFRAVAVEDEEDDDCQDITRSIRRSCFGKKLTLRQYLAYDEDGQAYICGTRLLAWEGDV